MKHIGPDAAHTKKMMPGSRARSMQPRRHSLANPHAVKNIPYKKQKVYPLMERLPKKPMHTLAMPKKDKHGYY